MSSSASSDTDELTNSTKNPLASVRDLLADVDISTATDEEVSDLFDKIAQTIQNNRPAPPPEGDPSHPEMDSSGLPPMMQAMGGIMPPSHGISKRLPIKRITALHLKKSLQLMKKDPC